MSAPFHEAAAPAPAALPWADLAAYRADFRARHPVPPLDRVVPSLAERKQWLLWRYEPGETPEKKPRKMPYYANGKRRVGDQGSDKDRAGLQTYALAAAAVAKGYFDGVGFAFLPADGLIGIDLDGMIDPESGEISERCAEIIKACDSYTEYSPSGKGVHIICAGTTATFKSNKVGVEVFCGRQYFTFTAAPWPASPAEIRPLSEATLKRLRATVRGPKAAERPAGAPASSAPTVPVPPGMRTRSVAESVALAEEALGFLDASDYEQWIEIGMACKAGLGTAGYYVWDAWSAKSDKYAGEADIRKRWEGFAPTKVTLGSVFGLAEAAGWVSPWAKAKARKGSRKPKADEPPAPAAESISPANQAGAGNSDEPPTPPPDDGYDRDGAWRRELIRKGNGDLVDCRENAYMMLRYHPELKGVIWADEFARRIVLRKPPPWERPEGFTQRGWDENDAFRYGLWLAQRERLLIKSADVLNAAVGWAASDCRWNPVAEYLNTLVWDGVPRLDHWLTDYMGVKKTEYTTLVGRFFLIGMVARIYRPGCQMRFMPIFEGKQFRGKSSATRILGGEWYGDTPIDLNSKDAYQLIQGCWLYEIAELDAFNRAEATRIKAFVSSQKDRFRAPYERAPVDHLRQGVFFGTTNQDEYFKDTTGNTRYWPLRAEEVDVINLDGLAAARDQLFAEAVARFNDEERWHPTGEEQERLFEPEQADREIVDPWQSAIHSYLSKSVVSKITTTELLVDCLKVDLGRIDRGKQMSMSVGSAMKRIGWLKRRSSTGSREWHYERPDGWGEEKAEAPPPQQALVEPPPPICREEGARASF